MNRVVQAARVRRLRHRWETPDPSDVGGHRLAVCSVFKNEADYLAEWIDFHLRVGVEHFYLYDNDSTDDYPAVLEPHISAGAVSLHHIPVWPPQIPAYESCLRTYRDRCDWLAFIDIDEFMYSTERTSLADALYDYREHPAVGVHWLMFNTSGHILKPACSQFEAFTRCQTAGNRHVRLIAQPSRVVRFVNPHHAEYTDGLAVNENRDPIHSGTPEPPSVARLRVNHYWTRSVEEWFTRKLARGVVDGVWDLRNAEGLLMAERTYGDGEDFAIQRLLASAEPGDHANP